MQKKFKLSLVFLGLMVLAACDINLGSSFLSSSSSSSSLSNSSSSSSSSSATVTIKKL